MLNFPIRQIAAMYARHLTSLNCFLIRLPNLAHKNYIYIFDELETLSINGSGTINDKNIV